VEQATALISGDDDEHAAELSRTVSAIELTGKLSDESFFESPRAVAPVARRMRPVYNSRTYTLPAYSVTVLRTHPAK
jgi:hypothetical protein